ncbi:MAG: hypothetical protein U9N14_05830 [Pseudomonadota bacterium]|nr:hypothetical protein [Pseudomonadota bacterium]
MIKAIGVNRAILIVVLFSVNLIMGLVLTLALEPRRQALVHEYESLDSAKFNLLEQIDEIRNEIALLHEKGADYSVLGHRGFPMAQDRLAARRTLETFRARNRLSAIAFEMAPREVQNDDEATRAGLELEKTRIDVDMGAFLDVDIYRFVRDIQSEFPGLSRVDELRIDRVGGFDARMIENMRRGSTAGLVDSHLTFTWFNLPESPVLKARNREGEN